MRVDLNWLCFQPLLAFADKMCSALVVFKKQFLLKKKLKNFKFKDIFSFDSKIIFIGSYFIQK